jgi:hypothetical protein
MVGERCNDPATLFALLAVENVDRLRLTGRPHSAPFSDLTQ